MSVKTEIKVVAQKAVHLVVRVQRRMSVFLVDDSTYQKVAASLVHYQRYGRYSTLTYELRDVNIAKFVETLRTANYKSYDERYRESSPIPPFTFQPTTPLQMFQLLKSLECIEYQTYQIELKHDAEHDLENIMTAIRKEIIRTLPQYEAAKWG